jgi:hypothetical protein
MIDYNTWLEHQGKIPKNLPAKPLETNQQGGFDPQTDPQIKRFKHVDLITLPEDIKGTNCGNCSYMRHQGKIGFCTHKEIQDWVTDRNCCAYWDHPNARRSWEHHSNKE